MPAKLKKCAFLQKFVEYLGHIANASSICADLAKLEAIKEWPVPICIKHI